MKFILTKELGRLAKWLRILGFDTVYFDQDNLSSLIIQALRDDRAIITRNRRLLRPSGIKIVLIEGETIKAQIAEVLKKLSLTPSSEGMFRRCILCNEALVTINKEAIKDRVPEYVFKTQEDFITCSKCQRVYWQGTHWGNVTKTLEEISAGLQ